MGEGVPRSGVVTLSDVARAAGVGESTASRVIRNRGSFSLETQAKVLDASARLGYVPNRIAGSLASAGSKLVGIIIPSLTNIVFPDLLRGADSVLGSAGFQSVIGVTDYDLLREEKLIQSMLSWRPAALILAGLEHSARAMEMLRDARLRVCELLDTDGQGIDIVVGFSNRGAGMASGRHLIERGYRRIGYVGHDLALDLRAAKRFEGFRSALREGEVPLMDTEIMPCASSVAAGRDGLACLLARSPTLDAVYFSNDDMALGGYFLCLSRGIPVPAGIALFGYNGLDVGQCAPQPLSTIRTPRVAIGEAGARLVCAGGPATVVDLGFELLQGATT